MPSPFDARARTWDEQPRRVQLAVDIFSAIENQIPLSAGLTALDYGCGTGLLTLALAPRVRHVVAVDSSPGMLEVLSQKALAEGVGNVEPLQADFSRDPAPPGPFDLITSAMALHHVEDIEALLQRFFSMLGSGGTLALADLDAEDGSFHDSNDGIPHFGFDRDSLSRRLADCGFTVVKFTTAAHIAKSRDYTVFLVIARKP